MHALKLARSIFCYHAKPNSDTERYQDEKTLIGQIYHEYKGRYGYRRIHLELRRQGVMLNHKTAHGSTRLEVYRQTKAVQLLQRSSGNGGLQCS
ncbi:IS3 family transposase [Photobacterium damselae]|uniref:IS3 family transposase n=1 Tax=Photobacterium damselae TaxID=38293 RepID=UPI003CE45F9F